MKQETADIKIAFEKKMSHYIDDNMLLDKGDAVLVGLSGGSDSVCLIKALCELAPKYNLRIVACHINHMIRGQEADRDEEFCRKLCEELGIILETGRFDVPYIAQREKKSTELAAREVRYRFFDEISKKHKINKIATAHNKNDNAETIVMNYMRGSALGGLCGIDVKRDNIIRPILCMEKEEILGYIDACGLRYVTDSTNLSCEYTRNKIRNKLIPYIEENFNPAFVNTICAASDIIREENDFIESEAEKAYGCIKNDEDRVFIALDEFKNFHRALRFRIIRKAIEMVRSDVLDIGSDTIKRIDGLKQGKVSISKGLFATHSYDRLYFEYETKICDYSYKLTVGDSLYVKEDNSYIYTQIVSADEMRKEKNCVWFDLDGKTKITVRNRRDGDIIKTEGGTKKLKKLFIDEKIPMHKRGSVPIIECGNEILWVCSVRRSSIYKTDENTKTAVKIKYIKN